SEYMYQMATIVHHVISGRTSLTLTEDQLVDQDGNALTEVQLGDEIVAVPSPFPAEGWTVDYPNGGKYWNDFDRTNRADSAARGQVWAGTVHGVVGGHGVDTVTAAALKIALGMVALLAGLGAINVLIGAGLYWVACSPPQGRKEQLTATPSREDDLVTV